MVKEDIELNFTRYRDAEGNPTCALDISTGDMCIFLRTVSFGTKTVCCLEDGSNMRKMPPLEVRNKGKGTIIPHKNCPLWNEDFPGNRKKHG